LRVAAAAEVDATDGRDASLVAQAGEVVDAFDGFAGLVCDGTVSAFRSWPFLFSACGRYTHRGVGVATEIVSARDAAFVQRRGGIGDGGEADDCGNDGGEVDHFGFGWAGWEFVGRCWEGLWSLVLRGLWE
jgi:hypothetical protein